MVGIYKQLRSHNAAGDDGAEVMQTESDVDVSTQSVTQPVDDGDQTRAAIVRKQARKWNRGKGMLHGAEEKRHSSFDWERRRASAQEHAVGGDRYRTAVNTLR